MTEFTKVNAQGTDAGNPDAGLRNAEGAIAQCDLGLAQLAKDINAGKKVDGPENKGLECSIFGGGAKPTNKSEALAQSLDRQVKTGTTALGLPASYSEQKAAIERKQKMEAGKGPKSVFTASHVDMLGNKKPRQKKTFLRDQDVKEKHGTIARDLLNNKNAAKQAIDAPTSNEIVDGVTKGVERAKAAAHVVDKDVLLEAAKTPEAKRAVKKEIMPAAKLAPKPAWMNGPKPPEPHHGGGEHREGL
jgi:hypothetical protein